MIKVVPYGSGTKNNLTVASYFRPFFPRGSLDLNSCTDSWHERAKRVQNGDNGVDVLPEVDRKWKQIYMLTIIFWPDLPIGHISSTTICFQGVVSRPLAQACQKSAQVLYEKYSAQLLNNYYDSYYPNNINFYSFIPIIYGP